MNFNNLLEIQFMEETITSCEIYLLEETGHPVVVNGPGIITRTISKELYDKFTVEFPEDKEMPTLAQYESFLDRVNNEAKK
jgi:hypothetical protein